MLSECECELTAGFISQTIRRSDSKACSHSPKKQRFNRENLSSFFSFFMEDALGMFMPVVPRDELQMRTRVAEKLESSRSQIKACGMKLGTASVDLLEQRPLSLQDIGCMCVLYDVSYVILVDKIAFPFLWNDYDSTPIILERRGRKKYARSQLAYDYVLDNYIIAESPARPLKPISRCTASEIRAMHSLCEFGVDPPKTKREVYDVVAAYVSRCVSSAN